VINRSIVAFSKENMAFTGLRCEKGSSEEQEKLDYYVNRVIDIIFNT
jgi:hypothetical protein